MIDLLDVTIKANILKIFFSFGPDQINHIGVKATFTKIFETHKTNPYYIVLSFFISLQFRCEEDHFGYFSSCIILCQSRIHL